MTTLDKSKGTKAENARLREALRKIREEVKAVDHGDPGTLAYRLGRIDATSAIALGEDIFPGASR